jgi:hypothetical protein
MRRLILAKAQRRKGAKWRHLILKDHYSALHEDTAQARTKVRATVKAEGEFDGERKAFISMLERDPVSRHSARPYLRAKQEAG